MGPIIQNSAKKRLIDLWVERIGCIATLLTAYTAEMHSIVLYSIFFSHVHNPDSDQAISTSIKWNQCARISLHSLSIEKPQIYFPCFEGGGQKAGSEAADKSTGAQIFSLLVQRYAILRWRSGRSAFCEQPWKSAYRTAAVFPVGVSGFWYVFFRIPYGTGNKTRLPYHETYLYQAGQ